jgi:hypothetical protein
MPFNEYLDEELGEDIDWLDEEDEDSFEDEESEDENDILQ